jgi:hypothetical protein
MVDQVVVVVMMDKIVQPVQDSMVKAITVVYQPITAHPFHMLKVVAVVPETLAAVHMDMCTMGVKVGQDCPA